MTIDEFKNVDLRVGKVVSADRVEGSEKLLRLQINIGPLRSSEGEASESRQIISGIAKTYAPEDLLGKNVVIIANLDARMMMGLESQGMLLATQGENGLPVILTVEKDVAPGSRVT